MRARAGSLLFVLALLAGAGCLGYLSSRHVIVSDWSAGARSTLSAPSRAVLDALHGPVEIVSYASPGSDLRPTVSAFIARYRAFKPDLTLRFVDPDANPDALRKAGINVDGELVIRYRGREARLDQLSESTLTNALQRLARGGERIVAFVTGDGERRADGQANADLGTFMQPLEARGMRAVPLNFAQVQAVPRHTDLVVLASPLAHLPAGAVKALVDYVADGGNLLWLTDPGDDDLGLKPLADALGVRTLPGVLVDGYGAALNLTDPRMVALHAYPATALTRNFSMTTLFPQVAALARTSSVDWAAAAFLRSSPKSWTELQPIDDAAPSTIRFDPDRGELKGPLDFGLALWRLSPSPAHSQQRVAVIGDGDFLSNTFVGNGGNRALGERVIDWLLGDDALVDLPRRTAPDRLLDLDQGGLNLRSGLFLVLLPALLLGLGLGIAWRRRRR